MFWSVKVIFRLSYHYGEIKLPSQGFGTETWLPQFRKKSQNKINFFKVREKSGNFSLIQGKFTALGEIGEKWNFKDNIMFFILSWPFAWFNMAGLFSLSCKCFRHIDLCSSQILDPLTCSDILFLCNASSRWFVNEIMDFFFTNFHFLIF